MFGPGGRPEAVYDKFHLVPFGEYVPFAGLLGHLGISKLTEGQGGFSSGDGPHIYHLAGVPDVTPLICYEIIFPGAVTARQRPGWLVNVTDDSWFGPWAGPLQHLLIARVRAIEEGLPVARAANTGISAMIDPLGRITASLNLGRMGVVDAPLPAALAPTPYARFGDTIFALLLGAAVLGAFVLARKESR
jgi:apolipoprotein N-acyltransferase